MRKIHAKNLSQHLNRLLAQVRAFSRLSGVRGLSALYLFGPKLQGVGQEDAAGKQAPSRKLYGAK
jgi:hypothetical protein